ncbi:MAG: DNA-directed RNA polymerase subunit alpha [Elusimicrobiaceae bacterium]|nr:DNA-directed RNA polymerase subunit alpha [Elusimicrobiaceae bacterium]
MFVEELVLPAKVTADDKTVSEFYGKFIAEPYESGYGHTVGNSLRRILLSSLDGAAVTAVRLEGAVHEYSTLSGVREDVINILLNLKRLRVKMHSNGREYIYLNAAKDGAVTAADITGNDNVEVLNRDLVLAHLEPGAKLSAELEISMGRGYVSADEIAKVQRPAGFIPMDALFSPVTKVHYDVQPARVGQKTDYDRLVIEVHTDGTINPKDALQKAASLLKKSLHIFTPEGELADEPAGGTGAAEPVKLDSSIADKLNQPVDIIELSSRSANCLKAAQIHIVRDLVTKTDEELKAIKNFGNKSLDEIKEKLTEMGLSLGMDV